MNKKNYLYCVLFALLIAVITAAPLALFQISDGMILSNSYTIRKPKSRINADISQMYLVREIHNQYLNENDDIYALEKLLEVNTNNYDDWKEISEQFRQFEGVLKLAGLHIPDSGFNESNSNCLVAQMGVSNIYRSSINLEDNLITFDTELQTQKITYFSIITGTPTENIIQPELILQEYIEYMGLQIIDDWEFSGNKAVSVKADLRIIFSNSNTKDGKNKIVIQMQPDSIYQIP